MAREIERQAAIAETFTAADVCAAAQIKASTLRAWRRRGVIPDSNDGRHWTRYSRDDRDRVIEIAGLVRQGYRLSAAAALVAGGKA